MAEQKECWSVNGEDFKYGELGDLLDENDEIEAGATVYVGDAIEPNIAHLCDDEDVIDIIRDRAYDIAGDYAEDCAEVSAEARAELKALLRDWIEKHCNLNFYTVENVRPYKLSHDDFPNDPTPIVAELADTASGRAQRTNNNEGESIADQPKDTTDTSKGQA